MIHTSATFIQHSYRLYRIRAAIKGSKLDLECGLITDEEAENQKRLRESGMLTVY